MNNLILLLKSYGVLKRLIIGILLLCIVYIIGVWGFVCIEDYSFLDAIYMTMITITTVGFSEVRPLTENGKIFTVILIFVSVITYVYALSVVTSFIIEGEFRIYFKHLRVKKEISLLSDHVIICGFGRNGRQACKQLASSHRKFVVVEKDKNIIEQFSLSDNILFVEGDSTEDSVLEAAGIHRAYGLISTLPEDADNVFVVLTSRELNSKLKIVSRASNDSAVTKLKRAGANNVISPDKIGGTHMAILLTKPDVLEFIDYISGNLDIRIEEINFNQLKDQYKNKSMHELDISGNTGANIIGFKDDNGEYNINPSMDMKIIPDSKVFVLGFYYQINQLKEIYFNT